MGSNNSKVYSVNKRLFCFTSNFRMLYWCRDCKKVIRDNKFLQCRFFLFVFRALQVTSWNVRSFLGFPFMKYKKNFIFRKQKKSFQDFHFLKYNKFSWGGFLLLLGLGLKNPGFYFETYEKIFLLIKYNEFF